MLRSGTRAGGSGKGVVEGDGTEGGSTEPGKLRHPQGGQGRDAEPRELRPLLSLLWLLLLLQSGRPQCPVERLELRQHETLGWLAWLLLLHQGRPWRLHFLQLRLLHEPFLTFADAMLEPGSRGSNSRSGRSRHTKATADSKRIGKGRGGGREAREEVEPAKEESCVANR